jgi:hypothetical protein
VSPTKYTGTVTVSEDAPEPEPEPDPPEGADAPADGPVAPLADEAPAPDFP